jgi:pimeloyl-ACP methyl ester carboxylesterase
MTEQLTRYAQSNEVNIAYQTLGNGPMDVVFIAGWASNVEDVLKSGAEFFGRIAEFARVIVFDKRGTGLSDPVVDPPSLEVRMDDLRAVMDAVHSERAALFGMSEGGPMSILFAATYPERASHLILSGSFSRLLTTDDYPYGHGRDRAAVDEEILEHWAEGYFARYVFPSVGDDPEIQALVGRTLARGASPAMARKLIEAAYDIDVRDVLSVIDVPSLIHHRRGDQVIPSDGSEYLARHIENAVLWIEEGDVHVPYLDPNWPAQQSNQELSDRIQEFLTGIRPISDLHRVLATVMFTDIIDSTKSAATMGDRAWRDVLDRHDAITRRHVESFRGRVVKQTGDGAFATFDRPAAGVKCALAIRDEMPTLGISIRAGVHTGEVEQRGDHYGGIGVHIGGRISALAGEDQVFVSRTVRDLVAGSGLEFVDRGLHTLKGVPDDWQILEASL